MPFSPISFLFGHVHFPRYHIDPSCYNYCVVRWTHLTFFSTVFVHHLIIKDEHNQRLVHFCSFFLIMSLCKKWNVFSLIFGAPSAAIIYLVWRWLRQGFHAQETMVNVLSSVFRSDLHDSLSSFFSSFFGTILFSSRYFFLLKKLVQVPVCVRPKVSIFLCFLSEKF